MTNILFSSWAQKTRLIMTNGFMLSSTFDSEPDSEKNGSGTGDDSANQKKKFSVTTAVILHLQETSSENMHQQQLQQQRVTLAATAIGIMKKIKPPSPRPNQ